MKNVILDVDTGIDDALAISYAVHSPELHILGITTSFGNTSVQEATRNTLQILEALGAEDIPVIPGVANKLNGEAPHDKTVAIHGENGLGEAELPSPATKARNEYAHDFIISAVHQHPNDITLLTVASQINLAIAIKKDHTIIPRIEDVIVMGGAVKHPGNITPYAEANIYTDPEAAQLTFQSGLPITLTGLDVTMQTLMPRTVLNEWRDKNTILSCALADACDFYTDAYVKSHPDVDGCALHDPLTIGIALDPSFVRTESRNIDVMTEGENIGQTFETAKAHPNMNVCFGVDAERFVSHFLSRVV